MRDCITQLCGLAILCGLALSLTPEGAVKRTLVFCSTVLLLLTVLRTLQDFDYASYGLELARYRELGISLSADAEEKRDRLSRQIVAEEYGDYIRGCAESVGLSGLGIEIGLRWETEGFWAPERVVISGRAAEDKKERLLSLIEAELGLDRESMEWVDDEA